MLKQSKGRTLHVSYELCGLKECTMIKIDSDKCTLCGKCAEVCPSGIIASKRVDGKRRVFIAHEDWCNLCAHCLAVCEPHAICVSQLSYDDVEALGDIDVPPEEMKKFLLARRSVRQYKPEPVGDEAVRELIEVASHAGTGGNLQSVGFVVVRDRELIDRLEAAALDILWRGARLFGKPWLVPVLRLGLGHDTTEQLERYYDMFKTMRDSGQLGGAVFRNAPAVMLAYDRKSNRMGALNCAIAMRNVEVMAMTMELGTCWSGFLVSAAHFRPGRINALAGIGQDERIYGALMLGYPKYTYNVKLPRKARSIRVC
jgi:nitroreductase/ferredoxin